MMIGSKKKVTELYVMRQFRLVAGRTGASNTILLRRTWSSGNHNNDFIVTKHSTRGGKHSSDVTTANR